MAPRSFVLAFCPHHSPWTYPQCWPNLTGVYAYTNVSSVLAAGFDVISRNSTTNGSVFFGRGDLPNCTESLTQYVQMRRTRGSTASALRHAGPPTTVLHHHRSHIHTEEVPLVHEMASLPLQQLLVVSVP